MYWIYAIFERVVWLFTFLATRLTGSFKIVGRENLANLPRPLMIMANHRSFFDPLIIGTIFPFFSRYIPLAFMVDDKYYNNPILKIFFRLTQTFPSYYGQGLEVSLRGPRQVLQNGGVFLIFPSGERHLNPAAPPPRPRRGAAVLALETPNLAILPFYIKSHRGNIQITIGRAFKLTELTSSREIETVSQKLTNKIYELQ